MKSPDEIKKGLECCAASYADCHKECPYKLDCDGSQILKDALALIQQLQADNAEKDQRIRQLEEERDVLDYTLAGVMHSVDKWLDVEPYKMDGPTGNDAVTRSVLAREIALKAIEQAQTERDAAVAELANSDSPCDFCKYLKKFAHETPCNNCVHVLHGEDSQFKWRGVQKEE